MEVSVLPVLEQNRNGSWYIHIKVNTVLYINISDVALHVIKWHVMLLMLWWYILTSGKNKTLIFRVITFLSCDLSPTQALIWTPTVMLLNIKQWEHFLKKFILKYVRFYHMQKIFVVQLHDYILINQN